MRERAYYPLDDAPVTDADAGFLGVDNRVDPARLEQGMAEDAVNMRFDRGQAASRRGIKKFSWSNPVSTADTNLIVPYNTVYGVGAYRNPSDGIEWTLIATADGVYRTRESNGSTLITLPVGTTISAGVTFTQCMDVVIMFRGHSLAPLVMTDIDSGFVSITLTASTVDNPGDGTDPIPNAQTGEYIQNRVMIPYQRTGTLSVDLMAVSDILNYTRYKTAQNDFRINQGTEDNLIRLYKFGQTSALAFKERSVYALANLVPDEAGVWSGAVLDEVTREYGLKARRAVCTVGKDVWFLADGRGVVSITQTEQGKLQGVDLPMSEAMQKVVAKINWRYADGAAMANWNNRVYVAVPYDTATVLGKELLTGTSYSGAGSMTISNLVTGRTYRWTKGSTDTALTNGSDTWLVSTDFVAAGTSVTLTGTISAASTGSLTAAFVGVNNAVLVYDLLSRQWSGYDISQAIMVKEWVEIPYNGQRRLFFLSDDGFLNMYEEGWIDEYQAQEDGTAAAISNLEIAADFKTRGYLCGAEEEKTYRRATLAISTFNPSYTVKLITEGYNETGNLAAATTRDRTAYYWPFDAAAYAGSNSGDDFHTAGRQDYSIVATGSPTLGTNLMTPDTFQDFQEKIRCNDRKGRWAQLRIQTTQGAIRINNITIEATAGRRADAARLA